MGRNRKKGVDSGLRVLTVAPSGSGPARVTWPPPHPHGPESLHLRTKRMAPPWEVWGWPPQLQGVQWWQGDRGTRPVLRVREDRARVGKEKCESVSCSVASDFCDPWTAAHQAPLSTEFSRWEYWSGLPSPSPGDLPNPGIEHGSSAPQADSLPTESPGKPSGLQSG